MNLENNQPVKSDDNQEHSTKVDNSRRSFAKKSAAIAPVIMTLANRSAWAGTNVCQSGFVSYTSAGFVESHTVFIPPTGSRWRRYSTWSRDPLLTLSIQNQRLNNRWPTIYPANNSKIIDVLTNASASGASSAQRLLGHQVATLLNKELKPFHNVLDNLWNLNSLTYYDQFYTNCAS